MSLLETLRKDMFEAKKIGEIDKANILGMAVASVSNFKIEVQRDITDEDVVTILRKEEKKLKDAFEQFSANGRTDLAQKEELQLKVVQSYLPVLMTEEEVTEVVKIKVASMGDVSARDMGKIMGMVMQELKGKADGTMVSAVVKKVLIPN